MQQYLFIKHRLYVKIFIKRHNIKDYELTSSKTNQGINLNITINIGELQVIETKFNFLHTVTETGKGSFRVCNVQYCNVWNCLVQYVNYFICIVLERLASDGLKSSGCMAINYQDFLGDEKI